MEDGGDHQPSGRIHRHAQVHVPEAPYGAVLNGVGVEIRIVQDGPGHGEQEHIPQGDPGTVPLHALEELPVSLNGGGVEGEMLGELGHGLQGVHHASGDDPADIGEFHILVLRLSAGQAGVPGRESLLLYGQSLPDRCALAHETAHVPLDDPSVGAGSGSLGGVHTGCLRQLPGTRGHRRTGSRRGGGSKLCPHPGSLLRGSRGGGRSRTDGPQRGAVLPLCSDGAHVHQAGNLVPVLKKDFQQLAPGSGLALEGRLVRLIIKQDIPYGDAVANRLSPLADDAGFYRDASLWHQHSVDHNSSSSVFRQALCLSVRGRAKNTVRPCAGRRWMILYTRGRFPAPQTAFSTPVTVPGR